MKSVIKTAVVMALVLSVTSCATGAKDVEATYVPTSKYKSKSCRVLKGEFEEVNLAVRKLSKRQDDKASSDALSVGIGTLLFWPSLFFVKGNDDNTHALADLKGEFDAIKASAEKRKCGFIKEFNANQEVKRLAKEAAQA